MMSARGHIHRQRGITLAEMVIALAIGALIVAGSIVLLHRTVSVADENKDKSFASLQVQFVGFWINEDAQVVRLGDAPCDPDGFPLTMSWWRGDGSANETVRYYFVPDAGTGLRQLYRDREVWTWSDEGGEPVPTRDDSQSGTHIVAEDLVPWDEATLTGTRCWRETAEGGQGVYALMKSLRVQVAADVDGSEAESDYKIFPRASLGWRPVEEDEDNYPNYLGRYVGPPCPDWRSGG